MASQHRKRSAVRQGGWTMVELLVAMALTTIVMGGVYSAYKSQQDSYVVQDQVAEMQQNLRAAMYTMARDLRMVGYNPTNKPNLFGLVTDLPASDHDPTATTSATNIAFTIDDDGNGNIDINTSEQAAYRLILPWDDNGNGVIDNASEAAAYRLNSGNLQRYTAAAGGGSWQTVAENIEAFNVVYLDRSVPPTDITTDVVTSPATAIPNVRAIQITLVARARYQDRTYTDRQAYTNLQGVTVLGLSSDFDLYRRHYRRRILSTTIMGKNLGL
jgi:type IV pilus assembly protein PilW